MESDQEATKDSVEHWLSEFKALTPRSPWGIFDHAYIEGTGKRREHLALGFIIHGNECGTLPAAVRLLSELRSGKLKCAGPVSLLLGNPEAARKNVRFVEEDFNRVHTFDRPAQSLERRRAEEVRPLLDDVSFLLDFHQTQTPTQSAFWTFPWHVEWGRWARIIGAAPRGLTRKTGGSFSEGQRCMDEYVRDRGRLGLTVELGMRGFDDAQALSAYTASVKLIEAYDTVCQGHKTVKELAQGCPDIEWYETIDIVRAPSESTRLRDGLSCFSHVEKGERLTAEGSPPLFASEEGYVLFPKYPKQGQPMSLEMLRLARPIMDPDAVYGPSE